MSIEFLLLMLAGPLILLAALALGLARRKTSDPKRAFLLAVLHDLPASGEDTGESAKSTDAHETVGLDARPGSRISDFFA
jgi:hypothetical protein